MILRQVPAVPAGGTLRIVAPCGVVTPEQIREPMGLLERAGYRLELGTSLHSRDERAPYLAGTDADRAADLVAALRDPSVDAVVCARGGYGAMRLLEHLPSEGWDAWPGRVLTGFSDVTCLHGWMATITGARSLHGPLLSTLSVHDDDALPELLGAMRGTQPSVMQADALLDGEAQGLLIGGNLSLVAALVGTKWFPPLAGAIVYLEDVGEPAYSIDRMLTSLMWRGLEQAAGLLFGDLGGCGDRYVDAADHDAAVRERALTLCTPLGIPVAWGAPFGHRRRNRTLHFGGVATLACQSGVASLQMESAVRSER